MVDLTAERIDGRSPIRVAVTHANAEADAFTLLESVQSQFDPVETLITPLSPVIGAHAGPGTIALNFMYGMQ
jgi:fatty acid-binding protein DegV